MTEFMHPTGLEEPVRGRDRADQQQARDQQERWPRLACRGYDRVYKHPKQ
jgi:hypothetical protein